MDDLISRQAAIDAVAEGLKGTFVEYRDVAEKMLNKVPPAQPKSEERTAESAQNVPKEDFISRKAAIEAVEILLEQTEEDSDVKTWNNAIRGAINSIKHHVPSAQQVRTQMSSAEQMVIDANGLDEEIRCEMCKNPMHTDRGCDGNCKYDEILYEKIIQILNKRITPLPPAQPEIVRCKNCKHRHLDGMIWDCPFGLSGGEDFFCAYGAKDGDSDSAQPLIRCRDCKHHHYQNDIPYCDRIDYGYGWKADDFCSHAERRTDEGD